MTTKLFLGSLVMLSVAATIIDFLTTEVVLDIRAVCSLVKMDQVFMSGC